MARSAPIVLMAAAVMLAGCAGKAVRNEVAHAMIPPGGVARTGVEDNQQFVMANPIAQPLPAWPQDVALPDGALPLCVAFLVSEEGAVHSVQALDGVADCMHADRPGITPFVGAALAAVAQWQFFGAGLCTWQQEQAECADGRAEVSPLAIRLSYRFVFRSNGRGDARALNAGGGAPILSAARRDCCFLCTC